MSIICTKCGSTNISTAMINPNNQEVKGLIDEPSLYSWCEDCKALSIITDVEETKKIIRNKLDQFVNRNGQQPHHARCRIVWKDTNDYHDVKIQLSADAGEEDDMFFYCDSFDDLLSLTDWGGEDFVMTECFGFEAFTENK